VDEIYKYALIIMSPLDQMIEDSMTPYISQQIKMC